MKHPKFQIYQGRRGQFRFRLKARNGEVVLVGEAYGTASSCRAGIRSVRSNATKDKRYRREVSTDGQPYFLLTGANGQVIGVSERYTTRRRRDGGIEAVKRIVPEAPVEEIF